MQVSHLSVQRNRMAHVDFDYLHFEPKLLEERLPLVVYLHGSGHKGTSLAHLSKASLPTLLAEGLDLPAHVVCPLAKPGPGWLPHHVAIFIEEAIRIHNCDPLRIYLTGESMGGRGVFEVSYWSSQLLAAIVPICAFGIPNLAPWLKDLPTWMFHGSQDDVLPVDRSRDMYKALRREGAPVELTELEGQGHAIAASVYDRREVWDWLFQQSRTSSPLEPVSGA